MIKVVIFDFDDTICLTEEACFILENRVAESMNFPPMTRKTHQKNWGLPLKTAIVERLPGINVDEFIKRQIKFMAETIEKGLLDKIPQENLDVLESIKKGGKKLAILTSRDTNEVKHLLHESHPFNGLIEAFYHRDNSKYHKPDPRVFDEILDKLESRPEESVYVGDAISDAAAAKGAGMHFIAVLESGLRDRKYFAEQEVDFFAPKFVDIIDYLLRH